MEKQITYKDTGVDISRTDNIKSNLNSMLDNKDERVMNKIGAFAALYDFKEFEGIKEPVLALKAEEPGSKQKLAFEFGFVESICHDMINHLVNDIIVMGAMPLTVLDVIITGEVDEETTYALIKGMMSACKNNFCSLVGGETSIQPGIITKGISVLSSSIVGVVDKTKIIDGRKIHEGDVIIALESNGLHTNGYTLVRKLMELDPLIINENIEADENFLQIIMRPHTAYYPIMKEFLGQDSLVGMAHITGGGIKGNLCRIIPDYLCAEIELNKIDILPIFKFIKNKSGNDDNQMLDTFNCGVGLTLVVRKGTEEQYIAAIKEKGINAYIIGNIVTTKGEEKVTFKNNILW